DRVTSDPACTSPTRAVPFGSRNVAPGPDSPNTVSRLPATTNESGYVPARTRIESPSTAAVIAAWSVAYWSGTTRSAAGADGGSASATASMAGTMKNDGRDRMGPPRARRAAQVDRARTAAARSDVDRAIIERRAGSRP